MTTRASSCLQALLLALACLCAVAQGARDGGESGVLLRFRSTVRAFMEQLPTVPAQQGHDMLPTTGFPGEVLRMLTVIKVITYLNVVARFFSIVLVGQIRLHFSAVASLRALLLSRTKKPIIVVSAGVEKRGGKPIQHSVAIPVIAADAELPRSPIVAEEVSNPPVADEPLVAEPIVDDPIIAEPTVAKHSNPEPVVAEPNDFKTRKGKLAKVYPIDDEALLSISPGDDQPADESPATELFPLAAAKAAELSAKKSLLGPGPEANQLSKNGAYFATDSLRSSSQPRAGKAPISRRAAATFHQSIPFCRGRTMPSNRPVGHRPRPASALIDRSGKYGSRLITDHSATRSTSLMSWGLSSVSPWSMVSSDWSVGTEAS